MKLFLSIILSLVFILPARAQTLKNALLIPYRDGEKWGYSDTLGKVVIQPQFDSAGFITVQQKIVFGVVCQNNKKGLILPDGQMLLPVQYDQIGYQCFDNAFIVDVNGKKGIASETGTIVPVQFDKITYLEYQFIGRSLPPGSSKYLSGYFGRSKDGLFFIEKNGQMRLIDEKEWKERENEERMPMAWDTGEYIDDDSYETDKAPAVPPGKYDKVTRLIRGSDLAFLVQKGKKYGVVNSEGEEVIPPAYDDVKALVTYNGIYFEVTKKNKKGIVNTENEVVLPIKYDKFELYKEWYIRTYQNNKKGLFLMNTFYPPIKPLYEEIEHQTSIYVNGSWSFAVFKVQKNGKTGYVGENGVEFFRN